MHDHHKTDEELLDDVIEELREDSRVDASPLGVTVRGGVVTLNGSVSSWAQKVAATRAVHRVSGVLDLVDETTVQIAASAPADAEIAAAVHNALRWDAFVPDDKVRATVAQGLVTLTGEVETYAQREEATRAIRNLLGVRGIVNSITVGQTAEVTPDKLRAAIQGALERHADRDAEKVQIDVEGGDVTLRGKVHSWRERDAVVGAVIGIRGVENVVDRIQIV